MRSSMVSGGDEVVDGVRGPDAPADLGGDANVPDDPLEDGDVALLPEGAVEVHKVEVPGSPLDPHLGDFRGVGHDDLLAPGDPSHELDDLMVEHVHSGYDDHSTDSAKAMKFLRNAMPDALLFSGWNWVP